MFCVRARLIPSALVCLLVIQMLGCQPDEDTAVNASKSNAQAKAKPSPRSAEEEKRTRLNSAQTLIEQGKVDQAWDLVNRILLIDPADESALRLAVAIKQQQGEFPQAAELALQIVESNPVNAVQMLLVAFQCHLKCQEFALAEADLMRAVAASPGNAQTHRILAQFLNAQGRRIEASMEVYPLIRLG